MKKLLLFLFCAFIFSTNVSAQELVPLTVTIDNDLEPIGNGSRVRGKSIFINTIGWKSGVYIVEGVVNGQKAQCKIVVK